MKKIINVRTITVTALLSAIGFILMYVEFSVPVMPVFIKLDLSEFPALIGTFALGPTCGIMVCLVKNLIHLTVSSTMGVGELANALLGIVFVGIAGLVYKKKKTKMGALIGASIGAVAMGLASIPINYFITYPFYYNFMSPEAILSAYQMILPGMKSILQCLVVFNFPFTAVKGLFSVGIAMLVYKHLSPLLKGRR